MKVLVVEPGYSPYETQIENTSAAISEIIETERHDMVYPFGNRVIAVVCGQDDTKPYNRNLSEIGLIQGIFIVCGSRSGQLVGLTKEQAQRYARRLHFPEKFEERDGKLYALPSEPKIKPKDERLGNPGRFSFFER